MAVHNWPSIVRVRGGIARVGQYCKTNDLLIDLIINNKTKLPIFPCGFFFPKYLVKLYMLFPRNKGGSSYPFGLPHSPLLYIVFKYTSVVLVVFRAPEWRSSLRHCICYCGKVNG